MNQTLALFLDAYRDLNSRKLFWIVLILSALVAGSFALVGLTPTGFQIMKWNIPSEYLNSGYISPADFYNVIFDWYGIGLWLTWAATILALVSTGGLFPDFIATGAVDLYLSKPISRLRLFVTKYLFGLLFVAVQIVCFCGASFLVIGFRGGVWEPGLFIAVPLVVLFFSYLFCVCVFLGVWTRSTIAAVLLTILFWLALWGVHKTENVLLMFKISAENQVARQDRQIDNTQKALAHARTVASTRPTTRYSEEVKSLESQLERQQENRGSVPSALIVTHQLFYETLTVLPKTNDTIDLMDRQLVNLAHLQHVAETQQDSANQNSSQVGNPEDAKAFNKEMAKRTTGWIIGTSLTFEFIVISLAAWVFCRRDY
jgi:ABC-type transport system involved in multi-copper enzyme maturation permease subunit